MFKLYLKRKKEEYINAIKVTPEKAVVVLLMHLIVMYWKI